jgi:hypothetical protein
MLEWEATEGCSVCQSKTHLADGCHILIGASFLP